MTHTRRQFVRLVPALGAFALPRIATGQAAPQPEEPVWPLPPNPIASADDSFPSQHPALAKEIVGVSHSSLARVKELLQQYPTLARASWDWGYGDWETALGAASHVGQRGIAELLLEHNAPPTIFSATMLGQLDVVKAFITTMPGAQRQRGPHGIALMVHAKLGGPPAAAVVKYLESLGDADLPLQNEPVAPDDRAQLAGRYTFGSGPRDAFVVTTTATAIMLARVGVIGRGLLHLGKLEFHPAGAPPVRVRFEKEGGKVVTLAVMDPDLVVRARRM